MPSPLPHWIAPSIRLRPARLAVAMLVGTAGSLAVGVAPADAASTTYYIACGSGGGDGSAGAPWTSLGAAASHGPFGPGDRILLQRGTTCHGRFVASGSGSDAAPIVLGAYGSGSKPTIAGDGTPGGTGAVEFDDVADWTVQDLHITNSDGNGNTNVERAGVLFHSTSAYRLAGLVAQRLTIDSVTSSPSGGSRPWGGISAITDASGSGFDGLLIKDNTITGVGRTGIAAFNLTWPSTGDQGLRITGNTVTRPRGDSIVIWGSRNARIDHNTSVDGADLAPCSVDQCGPMGSGSTASAGIWPINAVGVRIDHNEVSGEHADAGDGEGIDVDVETSDITVEDNALHDNDGGGILFCGAQHTVARDNVITRNGKAAITFSCGWHTDSPNSDIAISGNTILNRASDSAPAVVRNRTPDNAGGISFTNNTVTCSGPCTYAWPAPPTTAGNTYTGSHSPSEPQD